MIELPEAVVIAQQMSRELKGRRIAEAIRGNAPHKFAFYSRTPEEYARILKGKTMGEARESGSLILAVVEPGYLLALGSGGERIIYHPTAATLPKKHQLLLRLEGDSYLTVTVQGWGFVGLLSHAEAAAHRYVGKQGVSPLSDGFTLAYFQGLFAELAPEDKRSAKYFIISDPGVWGVGNGYLQDVLFRAKIHPRRRAVEVSAEEQRALYDAVRDTLQQAVSLGGRDSEHDLYDRPGGYQRILSSEGLGRPCPNCGTPIEKIQFLGGASYFCPQCQPEEAAG